MKKIAVAQMNETEISNHFGRSPFFGVYTIDDGQVSEVEMRMNTFTHHMKKEPGEGHKTREHEHGNHRHSHNHRSIVDGLADCQVVISGGMGKGAINSLSSSGMEIIITDEKQSQDAVLKYVNGELRNLNKACDDSLK
jgi:predicted Fe-Mo cluster-binding NifX family protein